MIGAGVGTHKWIDRAGQQQQQQARDPHTLHATLQPELSARHYSLRAKTLQNKVESSTRGNGKQSPCLEIELKNGVHAQKIPVRENIFQEEHFADRHEGKGNASQQENKCLRAVMQAIEQSDTTQCSNTYGRCKSRAIGQN